MNESRQDISRRLQEADAMVDDLQLLSPQL